TAARLRSVPCRRSPNWVSPLIVALYFSSSRRPTSVVIGSGGVALCARTAVPAPAARTQQKRGSMMRMAGECSAKNDRPCGGAGSVDGDRTRARTRRAGAAPDGAVLPGGSVVAEGAEAVGTRPGRRPRGRRPRPRVDHPAPLVARERREGAERRL